MYRYLNIPIETSANGLYCHENHTLCQFLRTRTIVSNARCDLFNESLESGECVYRCSKCIKAEITKPVCSSYGSTPRIPITENSPLQMYSNVEEEWQV